jgi:tetratricopeptide (TPR) repeat protein
MKRLNFFSLFLTGVLALLVLAAVGRAAPVPEKDAKDLKAQALALNDVTGDEPIQGQIKALLENPENTKKLLTVALGMAREKEQPFNYNALYILARAAHKLKEYDQAVTFYKKARDKAEELKSGTKLGQTFGGLIDLYYEQKKFDDAEKLCREFIEIDSNDQIVDRYKVVMLRRMIQALAKQEKFDEANRLVDRLVQAQPDNWLSLELKGWVQREAGQYGEAAKTYEDVLKRIEKDDSLKEDEKKDFGIDVRYSLSNIYLEQKKIDKVAEQLEALMKIEPDNPTWYNDLGYIWADHDMNFDKAEEYVRKALELDKKKRTEDKVKPEDDHDNPAYLDSLGWVLFKKKQYKEAKENLLKAVNYKDGHHIEIFDHLGDVHMALGEKAEAVSAWKKGLEVVRDSKREKEIKARVEKKIKDAQ